MPPIWKMLLKVFLLVVAIVLFVVLLMNYGMLV